MSLSSYVTSDRNPESSYYDSDDNDDQVPDLPVSGSSSDDEYTPTKKKRSTLYSTVYSSPTSGRSDQTLSMSAEARDEFKKFYKKTYGNCVCQLTMRNVESFLEVSHIIQRKSHPEKVSSPLNYRMWRNANASSVRPLRILPWPRV
jgi:hypothetical protein